MHPRRTGIDGMVKGLVLLMAACAPEARAPIDAPIGIVTAPTTIIDRGAAITFVRKPWTVGERLDDVTKTSTTLTMESPSTKMHFTEDKRVRKDMRVQEVDGDRVSVMYVHYDEWEEDATFDGTSKPKGRTLAGHTYIVSAGRGDVHPQVRNPDHEDVDEADEVAKSMRSDLQPDPFGTTLPGRPIHIGESVPAAAQAMATHFMETAEKTMTVTAPQMTLRRVEGDMAIFDISMKVSWSEQSSPVHMDLEGEAHVSIATTRTRRFEMHGPLEMTSEWFKSTGSVTALSTQTQK